MKRFVEGVERTPSTLFRERLDDWIGEDNPVRVIDVFVDELDRGGLGFGRVEPRATGISPFGIAEAPYLRLPHHGHQPADRGDERGIGARRLQFAPVSGQIAAQNGKIRPTRPREPNQSTKPQNPSRQIIQTHKPATQTKQPEF